MPKLGMEPIRRAALVDATIRRWRIIISVAKTIFSLQRCARS